nr:hypothetical protein [uncultured Cohaesibacter sp.]
MEQISKEKQKLLGSEYSRLHQKESSIRTPVYQEWFIGVLVGIGLFVVPFLDRQPSSDFISGAGFAVFAFCGFQFFPKWSSLRKISKRKSEINSILWNSNLYIYDQNSGEIRNTTKPNIEVKPLSGSTK